MGRCLVITSSQIGLYMAKHPRIVAAILLFLPAHLNSLVGLLQRYSVVTCTPTLKVCRRGCIVIPHLLEPHDFLSSAWII